MKETFIQKLRRVKGKDICHIFFFLLALIPAAILCRRRPHIWLICEKKAEARDNGYWLFRYLRNEQKTVDAVYAIDPTGDDDPKVEALGQTVPFGSLRHWVYYLAAEVNISSQKDGDPNAAVCYLLEVVLKVLKTKRVFLQHGITQNDPLFLHRDKCNFAMFCCGAFPEYRFIRDTFGYEEGTVQYLGFCRFDGLYGLEPDEDLILIMPTWRMELERAGNMEQFLGSAYYAAWHQLLASEVLHEVLRRYHKRVLFCMHRNMEQFESAFSGLDTESVKVLSWRDADINQLIHKAGMLITDFSSVAMDFAYMKRPLIYYQFDYAAFRETHWPEGYFDYARDGFGPVAATERKLLEKLEGALSAPDRFLETYAIRADAFYTIHDAKNCERTFLAIQKIISQ